MVRTEPTNNRTAGIDTNHSTMFALLLELNVICGQRWIQFELQNTVVSAELLPLMAKYTLPSDVVETVTSETETWLKLRNRDIAIKAETWKFETETRDLTFL